MVIRFLAEFIIVAGLAFMLAVASIATAGWGISHDGSITSNLFTLCVYDKCSDLDNETLLKIIAGFMIASLLLLFVAILVAVLALRGDFEHVNKSWIFSGLAGILAVVGVATYGGLYEQRNAPTSTLELGYSFWMACSVAVLEVISAVLAFVATRRFSNLHRQGSNLVGNVRHKTLNDEI